MGSVISSHIHKDGSHRQLEDHLRAVAKAASEWAAAFGAEDWARTAGLWHDLGKYQARWQKYLCESQRRQAADPHQEELEPARLDRPNHALAGAQYAEQQLKQGGRLLAYAVAGHHAGLPDFDRGDDQHAQKRLILRLDTAKQDPVRNELARALEDVASSGDGIPTDILAVPNLQLDMERLNSSKPGQDLAMSLWIRMLFSCLVDADCLDAEAFLDPEKAALRPRLPPVATLLPAFNHHMQQLSEKALSNPGRVNTARAEVLATCRHAALEKPGVYSLTVPTGGGKTLASLAFALEHAAASNKSRVIYAIPYTSIIEQTADTFRSIFKATPDAVIEHHSNLDPDPKKRPPNAHLAAENWDAPLIVTTNVQLFESLFAAKTSRCRKLHNLVNSVLVLDEAQLLPLGYLTPVVQTLKLLAEHYGVTVLLCTATQPNLVDQRNAHGHRLFDGIGSVREIIHPPTKLAKLYAALERVRVHLPQSGAPVMDWPTLAEQMCQHPAALAIVSTRNDAKALWKTIGKTEGAVHLSARMCAEHRTAVIQRIKQHLSDLREGRTQAPLRVVSTTLVEAGVDLDFPIVYRAFAGLDSIAQAAGRCNREGRLQGLGEVHVFVPEVRHEQGTLKNACSVTRGLIDAGRIPNPLAPESFALYFEQLRTSVAGNAGGKGLDEKDLLGLLKPNGSECSIAFRSAAEACQLIEDSGESFVVRWFERRDQVETALGKLRNDPKDKWAYRALQRFSVSVPKHEFEKLQLRNMLEPIGGLFVLLGSCYDPDLGVRDADEGPTAASLTY